MAEGRLQRTRDANAELNCPKHVWYAIGDSDIAPHIVEGIVNRFRVTYYSCIICGARSSYTRSQAEFEKEMEFRNAWKSEDGV